MNRGWRNLRLNHMGWFVPAACLVTLLVCEITALAVLPNNDPPPVKKVQADVYKVHKNHKVCGNRGIRHSIKIDEDDYDHIVICERRKQASSDLFLLPHPGVEAYRAP